MDAAFIGLIVIVVVALAFDYTNGFHDAANAIAVAVSTKALTSAKLRLYSPTFAATRTLQALRLSSPWSESTVNWNNQPPPTGSAASAPSRSSAGWVEFDVTAQLQAIYNGANFGFMIRDANETSRSDRIQLFESRDPASEHPPELVIAFK